MQWLSGGVVEWWCEAVFSEWECIHFVVGNYFLKFPFAKPGGITEVSIYPSIHPPIYLFIHPSIHLYMLCYAELAALYMLTRLILPVLCIELCVLSSVY